jgi:hypothetical protein
MFSHGQGHERQSRDVRYMCDRHSRSVELGPEATSPNPPITTQTISGLQLPKTSQNVFEGYYWPNRFTFPFGAAVDVWGEAAHLQAGFVPVASSCNKSDYWNLVQGNSARQRRSRPPTLDKSDHRHDLNIVGIGSNADAQRPVTCCREVAMKPPTQTSAATAEVDVRAFA